MTTGTTDWQIRPARADEGAALAELAERTFRDAFTADNRQEDMDLHCARSYGPEIQAAELADPTRRTLVADAEGRLIAFAQVHLAEPAPPGVSGSPAVELRRLYVDRRWHGSGLARELMGSVLELAADTGAQVIWLGVWERNPRAIRFYRNFGFTEVGDHVYVVGTDPQRDLILVRSVDPATAA